MPDNYELSGKGYVDSNGKKHGFVPAISWFTNLDHAKRHTVLPLDLGHKYFGYESTYPKYDNYDAINISKVTDIPCDYQGVMGVPITFIDKFCPEQFEIVGMAAGNSRATGFYYDVCYTPHKEDRGGCGVVNNIRQYARILIRFTQEYINNHPENFKRGN